MLRSSQLPDICRYVYLLNIHQKFRMAWEFIHSFALGNFFTFDEFFTLAVQLKTLEAESI